MKKILRTIAIILAVVAGVCILDDDIQGQEKPIEKFLLIKGVGAVTAGLSYLSYAISNGLSSNKRS